MERPKLNLPVVFNASTGEIVDDFGIRMFSVLTPGGHPNLFLGPFVAEALNLRHQNENPARHD